MRRAEAADVRRHELGTRTVEEAPQWAVDALGPVPADVVARQEWEHRAGWAAAWRELTGHTDEVDPLGAAPARGLVEKAALFRAAHEALRLLDAGHEEAELSDGRLRVRVRGWEREQVWAPAHVAEELAATHAAADKACADATVWAARADAPDVSSVDREQLRAAAIEARREAEALAGQVAALEAADETRARWYTHTAVSRDKAERSAAELRARGVDPYDESDRVTAQEWLEAERANRAAEDADREIRDEYELDEPSADAAVSEERLDVRERCVAHPSERVDPADRRRVPTLDVTAEAVARAQVALTEIEERHRADAERAARETEAAARAEELARWPDRDEAHDAGVEVDAAEPALER